MRASAARATGGNAGASPSAAAAARTGASGAEEYPPAFQSLNWLAPHDGCAKQRRLRHNQGFRTGASQ